jgi:hypothetical protein
MAILHQIEERRGIVQIDVGLQTVSLESRETESWPPTGSVAASDGRAKAFLDDRSQSRASIGSQFFRLGQKVIIEPNCRSHTSKHTAMASICQTLGRRGSISLKA